MVDASYWIEYYQKNKEKRNLQSSLWRKNNPKRANELKLKWAQENPDKVRESKAKWRASNKPALAQKASLERLRKRQAQPIWANKADILEVYKEAAYFGLEVDHIIPLTSDIVCGLHVWDNLQLLTKSDNVRKKNNFSIKEQK